MSPTSPRAELLERERRRSRPAGIAAILGAVLVQGGLIVTGSAVDGGSTSERLLEAATGSADGQLLAGAGLTAAGFVLAGLTLTFLFLAASARSERVRRQLVGLSIVGAVLVAGGIVVNHFAFLDAADNFAASEAEQPAASQEGPAEDGDADDEADDRAQDEINDASGASLSEFLVRGGALALAIGFFYTALWSMRTGLLTRFWGTFGMASAVVLALFFLYLFTLVWFIGVGLLLLGAWPGGRPPAWEEGKAIPWPKPGEDRRDPDAPPEGSGREVTEPPLSPTDPDRGGTPEALTGPRAEPRKRKRRR